MALSRFKVGLCIIFIANSASSSPSSPSSCSAASSGVYYTGVSVFFTSPSSSFYSSASAGDTIACCILCNFFNCDLSNLITRFTLLYEPLPMLLQTRNSFTNRFYRSSSLSFTSSVKYIDALKNSWFVSCILVSDRIATAFCIGTLRLLGFLKDKLLDSIAETYDWCCSAGF